MKRMKLAFIAVALLAVSSAFTSRLNKGCVPAYFWNGDDFEVVNPAHYCPGSGICTYAEDKMTICEFGVYTVDLKKR